MSKKTFKCKTCGKHWFKVLVKDGRFILICKKCKREYKLKEWINDLILKDGAGARA